MYQKNIVSLPINKLKLIEINPEKRTERKATAELKEDWVKYGQLDPIKVILSKNNDYIILDGNRRFTVARELNQDRIDGIVYTATASKYTAAELFIMLNKYKSFTQTDKLKIMRDTGISFSKQMDANYSYCIRVAGIEIIDLMILRGSSLRNVTNYSKKIMHYCKRTNESDVKKIMFWIVDNKQTYAVRSYMENKNNPKLLWDIIENDLQIKNKR